MRRSRRVAAACACAAALTLAIAGSATAVQGTGGALDPLTADQRAWLAANGPLRIGFVEVPPAAIVADGELTGGWFVEVHELAALKVGIDIELVALGDDPGSLAPALRSGDVHLVGGAGPRADLAAVAVPSEPIGWPTTVAVVNATLTDVVRDLDDLAGRAVTTIPGSPLVEQIADRLPESRYVATASVDAGVSAVADGTVDAYIGPLAVIGAVLQRTGTDLTPLGETFAVTPVSAWGLPDQVPLEIFARARSLITASELALIHVRWTGFDLSEPGAGGGPPGWVWLAIAGAVLFAVVAGLVAVMLRRRVAAATAELRELSTSLEKQVAARTGELRDVTERLRRSNRSLERYAQVAAHDLRGPLAAVVTAVDMMQGDDDLPADVREDIVRIIGSSSQEALGMIDRLLEAATAGAPDPTELPGPRFEQMLMELFAAEVAEHGAELTVRVPPVIEHVHVAALQHVAVNLVSNGLKHAGAAGGTFVEVALQRADHHWKLEVRDNGPGIPPDLAGRIFEPGFQVDPARAGAGLGLAAVRDAVGEAGGTIVLAESPGGGARFVVTLPVLTDDAVHRASAATMPR